MSLASARFRGNPRLERIAAGSTADYLRIGNSGDEVKAVQLALIDRGYGIPDGATGYFGNQTSEAVVNYKTAEGLVPNDPVVGVGTLTKLDEYFVLPFADHEEWASWEARPLGDWNFNRRKELVRQAVGTPFSFNAISNFLPTEVRDGIAGGLAELLNPHGSPSGPYTDSATWGASPLDLFHVHIVVDVGGADVSWSDIQAEGTALHARALALQSQANLAGPEGTPAWTAAYRDLLLAPAAAGSQSFCQQTGDILQGAVAKSRDLHQPLKLLWHTFELPRWRPAGMGDDDPRRGWWKTIAPDATATTSTPFTAGQFGANVLHLLELGFLVDQLGVITIMAATVIEAAAIVNLTGEEIENARGSP